MDIQSKKEVYMSCEYCGDSHSAFDLCARVLKSITYCKKCFKEFLNKPSEKVDICEECAKNPAPPTKIICDDDINSFW